VATKGGFYSDHTQREPDFGDLLSGEGVYTWVDGSTFKGKWSDPHPRGVMTYRDGSKVEGRFGT